MDRLVQGVGLILPFTGWFACGVVGAGTGAIVGLMLLIAGGRLALKWKCSACNNPVAAGDVRVCPACHVALG